jgi:hypothetical protein
LLKAFGGRMPSDEELVALSPLWVPLPGPQTSAYFSQADILYFGGSAGGGKSDLLLGLALTQHERAAIFRRQSVQLLGLTDRLLDQILKTREGWNGQKNVWRSPERQIEFGSCNNVGDEQAYQGRPHDLKAFDEIPHFAESQFRFLCGWLRSTTPGQRCRVVGAGNPPITAEERWVIGYWAPWLDPDKYPDPAFPGELRWFTTLDGEDVEVPSGEPFEHKGAMIYPKSRTFIPSNVRDNPYLMRAGYESTLQALPEPLRSQMLLGDFRAGVVADPWQVIPEPWVRAAQARWTRKDPKGIMDSMGVDVARGGRDKTLLSCRYGSWFDELIAYPGKETPDGPAVASQVILHRRNAAPVHIDIIGVGSSPFDNLRGNGVQTIPINGSAGSTVRDKTNQLGFLNLRAELWWRMREALDPDTGDNLALPPDPELLSDLCAPKWQLTVRGIKVQDKEEIKKLIGRSPDRGDAVVMALRATPKTNGETWGRGARFAKIKCNP